MKTGHRRDLDWCVCECVFLCVCDACADGTPFHPSVYVCIRSYNQPEVVLLYQEYVPD